ncbi:MAG: DNA-3-methyladenine glycosylase family protein [Alphaproteobacteria bacterium]
MSEQAPPDETLRPALEALAARDPDISHWYGTCGLPPVRSRPPGFGSLLHIMCAQQVSTASARAIIGRLDAAARPLDPRSFLALDDAALRAIGFSAQKVRYGRALATDVLAGRIDIDGLVDLEDAAAVAHLVQAKGIGPWTAEIYLMSALDRPDVWPADDLAVQVAAQRLKDMPVRPSRAQMMELAEPWRPYRSAAARLLWHIYSHPGVPGNSGPGGA